MVMGNITVTAIWKYFADSTHSPEVLGFVQILVSYTDWSMTILGVVAANERRLCHGLHRLMAPKAALTAVEPGTVRSRRTDLAVYSCAYTSQVS
jgi:hypothetical protein